MKILNKMTFDLEGYWRSQINFLIDIIFFWNHILSKLYMNDNIVETPIWNDKNINSNVIKVLLCLKYSFTLNLSMNDNIVLANFCRSLATAAPAARATRGATATGRGRARGRGRGAAAGQTSIMAAFANQSQRSVAGSQSQTSTSSQR